jgi:hypothetical protein
MPTVLNRLNNPVCKKGTFLAFLAIFLCSLSAYPKGMLEGLNFRDGANWALVGVSLFNYNTLPIQAEIGSFKVSDPVVLQAMQRKWHVRPFYQDHCEHHYALKIYRERELVRTLKINLHCHYITSGVFSYEFPPELFLQFRSDFKPLDWIKVIYKDVKDVRKAVDIIQKTPEVYLYHDTEPYRYDGFFIYTTPVMSWDVDRDSVLQSVHQIIKKRTNKSNFYITPYVLFLDKQYKISFKYIVFCNADIGMKFIRDKEVVVWRKHFEFLLPEEQEIELVILGLNSEKYKQLIP